MSEGLSLDLEDKLFQGMAEPTITDETMLSMMEGTCEEMSMLDYNSLCNLSAPVIHKMYVMIDAVTGKVGAPLLKRYSELWKED